MFTMILQFAYRLVAYDPCSLKSLWWSIVCIRSWWFKINIFFPVKFFQKMMIKNRSVIKCLVLNVSLANCFCSCTVGLVLPVYSTFKAIENKDQNEQQKWLIYWAAYGSFSIAEVFTDKLLSWFPLYYHVKFAFLVWLQLPSISGARQLYMSHLRPFLLRHQVRLDQIVDLVYSEMGKFVTKHQSEIQFARDLSIKILRSVREIVHPRQTQIHRTIEGPRRQIQDAPPDDDDDDDAVEE